MNSEVRFVISVWMLVGIDTHEGVRNIENNFRKSGMIFKIVNFNGIVCGLDKL